MVDFYGCITVNFTEFSKIYQEKSEKLMVNFPTIFTIFWIFFRIFFMIHFVGTIGEFRKISRKARESLRDDLFDFMQGTTDSEMTFALFLNQISDAMSEYSPDELKYKVVATIKKIDELSKYLEKFLGFFLIFYREAKTKDYSLLNFAVTDGKTVVVTRYVSKDTVEPATLYFSTGIIFIHLPAGVTQNNHR